MKSQLYNLYTRSEFSTSSTFMNHLIKCIHEDVSCTPHFEQITYVWYSWLTLPNTAFQTNFVRQLPSIVMMLPSSSLQTLPFWSCLSETYHRLSSLDNHVIDVLSWDCYANQMVEIKLKACWHLNEYSKGEREFSFDKFKTGPDFLCANGDVWNLFFCCQFSPKKKKQKEKMKCQQFAWLLHLRCSFCNHILFLLRHIAWRTLNWSFL